MPCRSLVVALVAVLGCASKAAPIEPERAPSAGAAPGAPVTGAASGAPVAGVAIGAPAPDAQLANAAGAKVALADVLHHHAQTVVVFYRGFW